MLKLKHQYFGHVMWRTGHSKHSFPTTEEKALHMDITRWSTSKLDWLYSLQPTVEKLYIVSQNKTGSWPWCWEWLKMAGEGDDRGWDGWMAPLPQWTWVWVNSRSWWKTERLGVLQSMGSHRVGHDWVTEKNWTEPNLKYLFSYLVEPDLSCGMQDH